jgi:nucleotide-binding universal stress UspA family protein
MYPMTDTNPEMRTSSRTRHVAGRQQAKDLRLLLVVDGSEYTNRIVDFIVAIAQGRDATEAVILNVQDIRFDARLRGYQNFKKDEIEDRLINELGLPIVNSVSNWLQKAGIVSVSKIKIGDPVPTVLRCATEDDCDVIVIGESHPQGFRRWIAAATGLSLPSSLASQLIASAPMPVVVVK